MNSRQTKLLTHIASWAALLLVPLMTMGHHDGITLRDILISTGVMLSFMVVFYLNYLWVTPRYYTRGERGYHLLYNAVIVVVTAILFYLWIDTVNRFLPHPRYPYISKFYLGFLLRSIFNLTIVAIVATALHLAARWQQTEAARREAEAARIEAELKALRNQINPHFLLNTLNNIYALTAFDTAKAQASIQQLSKMLRYILYNSDMPSVPLKAETDFIDNYVKLMRIRLPQSVDVQYQVDCTTMDVPIAPMLIISLVENAFKHGVSPTKPSFIHITITADMQRRCCDISNSNYPKSASDRSGHGIGLTQVQHRLQLIYPGLYTWEKGVSADGKEYHSRLTIYTDKAVARKNQTNNNRKQGYLL